MVDIHKSPWYGRKPKTKKEEESEFGPGKEDIIMCPEGEAVYYHKSWHHNLRDYEELSAEKNVKFELCPADRMKKEGKFEGQVFLENVPDDQKDQVLNEIRNIEKRAYKRDVLDRILELRDKGKEVEVRTSENQLAVGMGKQIRRAHKKTDIDIQFSDEESVARVWVKWPKS